jgi:hypothetical protein
LYVCFVTLKDKFDHRMSSNQIMKDVIKREKDSMYIYIYIYIYISLLIKLIVLE